MNSEKKKVILSIPLVWGIRNFFISGIASELTRSFDLYVAVPPVGEESIKAWGIAADKIIYLEKNQRTRLHSYVWRLVKEIHKRKFPSASDHLFFASNKKTNFANFIFESFAAVFSIGPLFTFLKHWDRSMSVREIPETLRQRIESIQPTLAISTSFVVDWEWPLFQLLQEQKCTTFTHVLSFDNLTSRGYLPISNFNKFLVWNDRMGNEVKKIYHKDASTVAVTGTPQFDFHSLEKYGKSMDWTCAALSFEKHQFIAYCANHIALTPDEPVLVQQIISAFQADQVLKEYTFVLRLHPMDDYARWTDLLKNNPSVVVSYPWPHGNATQLFWGEPTQADLTLFCNTLRHASLVLNIASTITIDAAMHDTPVVCVGFSSDSSSALNQRYYDYHFSDHYEPIMKMGASPIADSLETLVALSVQSLADPKSFSERRSAMVEKLCGKVDDKSSERILKVIKDFADIQS